RPAARYRRRARRQRHHRRALRDAPGDARVKTRSRRSAAIRIMPLFEAVRLALIQIRVQKLKSFFTLLGVMIGVMFLIAVVSIVEGMGRYMEDDFAGRLLGANTFTLRRYPWFGNNTTREQWLEWQRRAPHVSSPPPTA